MARSFAAKAGDSGLLAVIDAPYFLFLPTFDKRDNLRTVRQKSWAG